MWHEHVQRMAHKWPKKVFQQIPQEEYLQLQAAMANKRLEGRRWMDENN